MYVLAVWWCHTSLQQSTSSGAHLCLIVDNTTTMQQDHSNPQEIDAS
jgi:hypothetical protein